MGSVWSVLSSVNANGAAAAMTALSRADSAFSIYQRSQARFCLTAGAGAG